MTPITPFVINHGYDANGVHSQVTVEGDQVITKHTFDAEPILEACKAERAATAGDKWGEMRKVGSIPLAVMNQFFEIKNSVERQAYIVKWLKENQAFVTFDKFLK